MKDENELEMTWWQGPILAMMEVWGARRDKPGLSDEYAKILRFKYKEAWVDLVMFMSLLKKLNLKYKEALVYLHPEVDGTKAKTQSCAKEMNCCHWGLLQMYILRVHNI